MKVTFPPRVRAPLVSAGFPAGDLDWMTFQNGDTSRKAKRPDLTWHFLDWCNFEILPELRSASKLKCYHGYRTSGSWSGFCWFRLLVLSSHVFLWDCYVKAPTPIQQHSWPILSGGTAFIERKPVGIDSESRLTSFPAAVIITTISSYGITFHTLFLASLLLYRCRSRQSVWRLLCCGRSRFDRHRKDRQKNSQPHLTQNKCMIWWK